MAGAVRWGHLVVAVAVACVCAVLAPAAQASLSVPAGTPTPFTGSNATTASAMGAFEAASGGGDNGTALGEQSSGFRHVNWDGLALDGSDPGSTVIESGEVAALSRSRLQPYGIELGPYVAVSSDGFDSVNPHAAFTPFTAPNLWAPFNSNTTEFDVVVPTGQSSTAAPALTRGIGIVFLNVKLANTTTITYYNDDAVLGQVSAPVGTTSFAGLLFSSPVVTHVVITLGTATIFTLNGGTPSPGGQDGSSSNIVAADDVVLAEPAPARPNVGDNRRCADLAGARHVHRNRHRSDCRRLHHGDRLG